MMVWDYFTHFHKSALCYTDVHVYRATSLTLKKKTQISRSQFKDFKKLIFCLSDVLGRFCTSSHVQVHFRKWTVT